MSSQKHGFTIVELLIVIVVIAVLATISVAAYQGVQGRARDSKIGTDLATLDRAIQAARINSGKLLTNITGSGCTGCICRDKSVSTDLAALDKATDSCWTSYLTVLQKITAASGANVTQLVDPWGRPYDIDENEGVSTPPCGTNRDSLSSYQVGATSWLAIIKTRYLPYVTPGC